jgi:hypothetical protein
MTTFEALLKSPKLLKKKMEEAFEKIDLYGVGSLSRK